MIISNSEKQRMTTVPHIIINSCIIPPSRSAPQPVTQHDMPAGKTWEEEGRQMGWIVLVNSSGSLSSSSAMS